MKRSIALPDPARLRTVPRGFGWVDHRLLRHGHLAACQCPQALALYLILVTAADARGISYYSERRLAQILALHPHQIVQARERLTAAGLIAWRRPYYQLLSLDPDQRPRAATGSGPSRPEPFSRQQESLSMGQALRGLLEDLDRDGLAGGSEQQNQD
jgi:hypothetical protein